MAATTIVATALYLGGFLYGWWVIRDAHRHGDTSGLEYMPIAAVTAPISLVLMVIVEDRHDPAIYFAGGAVNFALVGLLAWFVVGSLLQSGHDE